MEAACGLEFSACDGHSRFAAYVQVIISARGHADRESVEPMAARVQPGRCPDPGRGKVAPG